MLRGGEMKMGYYKNFFNEKCKELAEKCLKIKRENFPNSNIEWRFEQKQTDTNVIIEAIPYLNGKCVKDKPEAVIIDGIQYILPKHKG
jgi:hypothetical protein